MTKKVAPEPGNGGTAASFADIPIDLLCEMAWRLVKKSQTGQVDPLSWMESLKEAVGMIRTAIDATHWEERARSQRSWLENLAKTKIKPLLTAREVSMNWISYERGCQIYTGIKKRADAVKRHETMHKDREIFMGGPAPCDFKRDGFAPEELAWMKWTYDHTPPSLRRKTYERAGRYRRNKQGRKRKSKN